jgi:RHS repeat-associated protein
MLMPGRQASAGDQYSYGYNGMRKDDEIKGQGNSYDFGARIYDPRVGRWLTIDPQCRKYPDLNPYNFVSNSPMLFVDPNGEEIIIHYVDANGSPKSVKYTPGIKPAVANEFVQQVHEAVSYVMKNDDHKVFQTIASDLSKVNIVQTTKFDGSANQTEYNKNGSFSYNTNSGNLVESTVNATVSWNPASMLAFSDGGAVAASTILLHEADHARGYLAIATMTEYEDWLESKESLPEGSTDGRYHNLEEKRVIRGAEADYIENVNSKAKDKWTAKKSRTYVDPKTGNHVKATYWRIQRAQRQAERYNHDDGIIVANKGVNSISRKDGRGVKGEKRVEGKSIKKIIKKGKS